MRKQLLWKLSALLKNIAVGLFCIFLFALLSLSINKNVSPYQILFQDTFPLYQESLNWNVLYKLFNSSHQTGTIVIVTEADTAPESIPAFAGDAAKVAKSTNIEAEEAPKMIGMGNVIFQPETDIDQPHHAVLESLTKSDRDKLKDFEYLKKNFYTVDKRTALLEQDIDVDAFLDMDFSVAPGAGPKVLIFHTHSQEAFINSKPGVEADTIVGVGETLADLLENKYGIETLHHSGRYDVVSGQVQQTGAYERVEPEIRRILEENPTIEVVIDMHRDGVREDIHLVTEINGKPTAQIMFFNGLTRTYQNGILDSIDYLPNPYVRENLALSFNLQLTANQLFPAFTRKIYINAFRYSLHMMPKTIFVEVGAQTNTVEEAKNAMEPLAEIIYENIG